MDWGPWKVHISRPVDRLGGDVTIYRFAGSEMEHVNVKDGECVVSKGDRGGLVSPTFRIGYEEDLRGILAAFTEAAATFGVKPMDASHAEGKLEATEKHLSDMRALVFKKPGE